MAVVKRIFPIDMMSASDYLAAEPENVVRQKCWMVDVSRTMWVIELNYGVIVETTYTDEEDITLTETLFGRDRKIFTLIGRWRTGGTHHNMRSYLRDSKYPLRSKVQL